MATSYDIFTGADKKTGLMVLSLPTSFQAVHGTAPCREIDQYFLIDQGGCGLFDLSCFRVWINLPDSFLDVLKIELGLLARLREFKNGFFHVFHIIVSFWSFQMGQAGYSMPPAALETSHDASVNLNCVDVLYVS